MHDISSHVPVIPSAKFWALSIHPPRALSLWGSFIGTFCSSRRLASSVFFKQFKIYIYDLRLTSRRSLMFLTKIPITRRIILCFFFCIIIENKKVKYMLTWKGKFITKRRSLHNLFMKCYLRGTLTDLRDTKVQKSLNCSQLCELPAHTSRFNLTNEPFWIRPRSPSWAPDKAE